MSQVPSNPDASLRLTPARSRPVWQLGAMVVGILLTGAGLAWYLVTPEPPTSAERLDAAVQYLEQMRLKQAREIAEELSVQHYHDVDFAGGVEYVLGMCQFRETMERPSNDMGVQLANVIVYLRDADRRGVPDQHLPTLVNALATSLYLTGARTEALPLLEEATHPTNPEHISAARYLIDLYLDPGWRTTERLQTALRLSDRLLAEQEDLTDIEAAKAQRVELLLALKDFDTAAKFVEELTDAPGYEQTVVVMQARILMGRRQFVEAVQLLEPIAKDGSPIATSARQACYLMGRAAELQVEKLAGEPAQPAAEAQRVEYRQRAAEYYRKTATRFEMSEEGIAALVHLGRLQQEDGADEKAIQSFGIALRNVGQPENFANRWLALDELRQRVLAAWNTWIQSQHFAEAIALADHMTPAFPRDQAYELAARARQRWAEELEDELANSDASERTVRAPELRRLWRESAAAYDRLAQARRTASNYPEAVWQAADHSYRGHDFQAALSFVDQFLMEATEAMRPVALVRRGQILLDLDRLGEAEENFRQVRSEYPTSPAAFTAEYQLAVCRYEQNDMAGAEAAWRSILSSTELTPAAIEWRDALFSLAKLQGDLAGWARRRLENRNLTESEQETLWAEVSNRAHQATELFEQYVSRYPSSSRLPEAQYHLGKALQLQGDLWRRQWRAAETENARQQSYGEMQKVLTRALKRFQEVKDGLAEANKQERLSAVQRQVLENAWFESPHTLFALQRYQDAIAAYAATIHRFPQDVRVLTAYVQMAEAYAQLDRPVEARSMLEQAKVMLDQDQIPPTAFDSPITSLTRQEWEQWLDRARKVHRE